MNARSLRKIMKLGFVAMLLASGIQTKVLANSVTVLDFEVISAPEQADPGDPGQYFNFDFSMLPNTQFDTWEDIGIINYGYRYDPGPNNNAGLNDLHIANQLTSVTGAGVYWPYNGTTVGGTHDDVALTRADGLPFHLFQFDFAGIFTATQAYETTLTVTGEYAGGGTVMDTFTPDGLVDGMGGASDFQTFQIATGEGWYNLTSVTFEQSGAGTFSGLFALDNIHVQVVPELSTWLLFAAGLVIIMAFHTSGSRGARNALTA